MLGNLWLGSQKYTKDPVELVYSLEKYSTVFVLDAEGKRIKRKEPFLGESDWVRQDRNDRTVCVVSGPHWLNIAVRNICIDEFGRELGLLSIMTACWTKGNQSTICTQIRASKDSYLKVR